MESPRKLPFKSKLSTTPESSKAHNLTQSCINDYTSLHPFFSNPAECTCWALLDVQCIRLCAMHLCCSGVSHLFSMSPFAATSAHSLSLLPSLLASASMTILPSFFPGLLSRFSSVSRAVVNTLPFHPWLYRFTDGPYRNRVTTCLYMCIGICEWVEGMAWILLLIPLTIHIQSGSDYSLLGGKVEQQRRERITTQLEN